MKVIQVFNKVIEYLNSQDHFFFQPDDYPLSTKNTGFLLKILNTTLLPIQKH